MEVVDSIWKGNGEYNIRDIKYHECMGSILRHMGWGIMNVFGSAYIIGKYILRCNYFAFNQSY